MDPVDIRKVQDKSRVPKTASKNVNCTVPLKEHDQMALLWIRQESHAIVIFTLGRLLHPKSGEHAFLDLVSHTLIWFSLFNQPLNFIIFAQWSNGVTGDICNNVSFIITRKGSEIKMSIEKGSPPLA